MPLAEAARVLCPGGVLLIRSALAQQADLRAAGLEPRALAAPHADWLAARKPRPAAMDDWPQPRHGPDANPVSADRLVAPPRRIRWVAGPPHEISNTVATAQRLFYAGVYAHDAFNGLRLWQRSLTPSPAHGGFGFAFAPGSVRPIADGNRLFVVTEGQLLALDAATGRTLRAYPEAGTPAEILYADGTLLALGDRQLVALDAQTGAVRWKHAAADPRSVVIGDRTVFCIHGRPRTGERAAAIALDLAQGTVRWQRDDHPWLAGVRGCVYHKGLLAYEVSTLSDDKAGNRLHLASAADGSVLWDREFVPGMAHKKQARAMFAGGLLWLLDAQRCIGVEPRTGKVEHTYPAGSGHCYPPVATDQFLFAGEMNLTDLANGQVDAHRITKGNCSRDAGFIPANGLIYTAPKHCVCWPMLRDYSALAPARGALEIPAGKPRAGDFLLEKGPAEVPAPGADDPAAWPCYRHDAWRSGSTTASLPTRLRLAWETPLGDWPRGPIADDWRDNSFVRGPVTPAVSAGGLAVVARPDAHQVVALDLETGQRRWTFTANGRVDTPPTLHRGLCLFGTRRLGLLPSRDDGRMVWRLRAAPRDERIVAYGQVESPWPVSGSVLVVDGAVFFAAGRQALADGGILVFSVEPASGKIRWVQRLDSVPQTHFYGAISLDFEGFDLLHREGDAVAMSRWLFDRQTGEISCDAKNGFARVATGDASVMIARGFWSYGPRAESELIRERPFLDPLAAFRDSALVSCSQDRMTVYRRDFRLETGEQFDREWYEKRVVGKEARAGGPQWRTQRLARNATWSAAVAPWLDGASVAAMALAPEVLFVAGARGSLAAVAPRDGKQVERIDAPPPVWDGLAAASGRLLLTSRDGRVLCFTAR